MHRFLLSACLLFLVGVVAAQDKPTKTSVAPGDPAALKGLLAYWNFDEGKGTSTKDAAVGKLSAKLEGKTRWVTGVRGSALQFDKEGDYLDLGTSPQLNFEAGAAFTFAGWVKTSADEGTIVSLRHNKDGGAVIDLTLARGKLNGLVRNDRKELGQHATVTGSAINDGEWHHFALTRDTGTTIELFVDGTSQGKAKGADAGGAITTDLRALGLERAWAKVGMERARRFLVGAVDDFCVYDRALTAAEIRKLAGPARSPVVEGKEGPPADALRYDAKGVRFDYPKKWKLTTEDIGGGSATVKNEGGTQVIVQFHASNAKPKEVLSLIETAFRKAFKDKVVKGSEKAVKRKFAGVEREGKAMDFEIGQDLAIHFDFFAFALGEKQPVVCVIFQHAAFDAKEAKKGFDLIAASLAVSAKGKKK